MVIKQLKLSASLEDYLEAIFNLSNAGKVARSKDISELLKVSKSSVTGALKTLSERGLINYRPYDPISLTQEGHTLASTVAKKHDVIKSFFVDVLGVNETVAQKAACEAEHSLGVEITNKLLDFIEFVTGHADDGIDLPEQFKKFCMDRSSRPLNRSGRITKPLSNVIAGDTVTVASINAGDGMKGRLLAMGMVPNAQVTVVANNPTGPFVVSVKGSKIMLGRAMVHKIMVN